ncbi:MAG: minichromosome maintenance protein MCM [Nitrososphaerales archaeon]
MEYTEAKVKDIFVDFLKTFKDFRNELKYRILISQLPSREGISVLVDYSDLLAFNTDIAINLVKEPELYLRAFDEAAIETLSIEDPVYAEKNKKEIHIRIRDLTDPLSLRDVAKSQLNTLIMVRGMVVRSSELRPMAVLAAFRCTNMHITYIEQSGVALRRPIKCETEGCGESKNFELDELKTEFIDFQIIRIQELPEELPPGQLPQTFDVHLIGDIVNSARPGDRIVLTGIVKAESEFSAGAGKLRLFTYRIEGNYVEQLGKSPEETEITREDEENIKALAALPGAYDRLIASVAPAIFGHEIHKEAVLLLMVGAKQKPLPDGATLRGDINILLVGDPGTAKSELLKYVSRVAPRALFTSGRGTTAAGLTAAVVREKNGMMMLEAGATVLADLGVAVIDEFDKMRKEDRDALHEVMEQQTASVAKGGFIATLNARTSILAAANPVFGKYDPYKNILDNVNLPVPLLTRFDLVFIVKDEPDSARDQVLAKHILDLHANLSFPKTPPIDFDTLKKYIIYAKKLDPELTEEARNRLSDYYIELRRLAQPGQIAVTPRWLEGLIRLSIARARLLLHTRVTEDDALRAVTLMRRMLETVAVDQNSETKQVDVGVLYGKPLSERNLLETALETFKKLEGSGTSKQAVEDKVFIDELVKTGRFKADEADKMLKTLYRSGQIYETKPHFYRKI